jgi:hypothetical protein
MGDGNHMARVIKVEPRVHWHGLVFRLWTHDERDAHGAIAPRRSCRPPPNTSADLFYVSDQYKQEGISFHYLRQT